MQPSFNLEGRIAVVTGGGGGLGTMTCEALARAGAAVAIVGRNAGKCEAVRQTLAAEGGQCKTFLADITSEDEVKRLFAEVAAEFGGVDILVNNAGVTSSKLSSTSTSPTGTASWTPAPRAHSCARARLRR